MLATKRELTLKRPYPGLRSFEPDEATLFHGRDRHTGELLRRLAQDRFLAVVGGSGSGKSSLVRAGLLPALYRGYLVGATSQWRVAVMRPGSAPVAELAKALAAPSALGTSDETALRESSFGLVNAVRNASMQAGESLLLVVDQFEELFRFRRESNERDGGAEASLFVSQLLEAADAFGAAIYVVITMRSDFLGDCAQFPGLPEALNKGQYLIPRMTREQRREAITDSLDLFDTSMSDRLVQRLLNDTGDDPDQLPVLQHALQQTYAVWEREGRHGEIDLDHYARAGTMENALHDHAQSVYESTGELSWLVERIFRCLTVDENNRAVRRPAKLERILRVIGVADDPVYEPEAIRIVKLFGAPEHSFLVWDKRPKLEPDSVVDISHESLIRKWRTLQEWVREETKAVDIYRYVRRDAGLYPNEAALWGDPDLSGALRVRSATNWNEAWAEQYSQSPGASFEQVQKFLRLSVEEKERLRRREILFTRLKWGAAALAAALLAGAVWGYRIYRENEASKVARAELSASVSALQSEKEGLTQRWQTLQTEIDERLRQGANDPKALAEIERLKAEQQRTQQNLSEREKLIKANTDQVQQTSQNYSESLKRINELQASLTQAWKERDEARAALEPPAKKGSVSVVPWIADLQSRLDRSEAEVARLQQQSKTASATPAAQPAPIVPLVVPQSSWQFYTAGNSRFSILLGDLSRDRAASAQMYVLPDRAGLVPPPLGIVNQEANVKGLMASLAKFTPCPSPPDPGGVQCFIVQKQKTNAETQRLGTVNAGSTAYTLHAMGWTQNAIGSIDVLSVALAPAGPAQTGSFATSTVQSRVSQTLTEFSRATTTVKLTLRTTGQSRYADLGKTLGKGWNGAYIYLLELSDTQATLSIGLLDVSSLLEGQQEVAKTLKRLPGSDLAPDSSVACTISEGGSCSVNHPAGHKLGITANSLGNGRAELTLTFSR